LNIAEGEQEVEERQVVAEEAVAMAPKATEEVDAMAMAAEVTVAAPPGAAATATVAAPENTRLSTPCDGQPYLLVTRSEG
jgi:hypothetical protein